MDAHIAMLSDEMLVACDYYNQGTNQSELQCECVELIQNFPGGVWIFLE